MIMCGGEKKGSSRGQWFSGSENVVGSKTNLCRTSMMWSAPRPSDAAAYRESRVMLRNMEAKEVR